MKVYFNKGYFGIIYLTAFFILYFFFTEKIYETKKFSILILIFLLISIVCCFLLEKTQAKRLEALVVANLPTYYVVLLYLINIYYYKWNNYFINKNWLPQKFINKDFTYVNGDEFGDYWKLHTGPPSWLDKTLSSSLLLLPIILMVLMYLFIKP